MKKWMMFVFFVLFSGNVMAGINVNSASPQEMAEALHGVGMKKAQAIYDYCRKNVCKKAEDLLHVKGIGQKTLDKIKDDLVFDDVQKGHSDNKE